MSTRANTCAGPDPDARPARHPTILQRLIELRGAQAERHTRPILADRRAWQPERFGYPPGQRRPRAGSGLTP